MTVKATVGETSTYYTPERQGEAFAVDIPLPPGSGEVTTDLEINAVRFDSEQDLDLVKTVTGSYTTSSEAMTYDLDGNLLTRDGWTFTWNGENRLIKAEKGLLRVEADYDYLGRRFEKKVYHGETLTSHQRFLYDDYKLVEIRDALNANALETAYLWQPLQLDVPVAMQNGTAWGYYLFDGNKNITSLRAEDGTTLAEYHYGPFGQTLSATGPWAAVNPFRFSSEYHDAETNLVYYNYRHYSPTLGRWLNRDPIEEQGGVNLYAMVDNNTISWWDDLGTAWYDAIPIIGTITGHWNATSVPGTQASDYKGIEVDYIDCCKLSRDGGGFDDLEDACIQKLKAKALTYIKNALAGLGVKTGIDATVAIVGLKAGPIGWIVTGVAAADGILGGWAIGRTVNAINAGMAMAIPNCRCAQYNTLRY